MHVYIYIHTSPIENSLYWQIINVSIMASLGLILYLSSVLLMSLCQLPTAIEDDRKASHCCYIYVSLPYLTIYVFFVLAYSSL